MATGSSLPKAVSEAVEGGKHIVQAFREHLGYSIEDLSVVSGLTIAEIEGIECSSLFDETLLTRIARALSLQEEALLGMDAAKAA